MSKSKKLMVVEPTFPASVAEKGETILPCAINVLTRAADPISDEDSGWDGQRVVVIKMVDRVQPYLINESLMSGMYELFAEPLGNKAPAYLTTDKNKPAKLGEMGDFNSAEIFIGLKNGSPYMSAAL